MVLATDSRENAALACDLAVVGGGAAGIPRVDPSASPPAMAVLWRKRVPAGLKAATRNTFYRTTAS